MEFKNKLQIKFKNNNFTIKQIKKTHINYKYVNVMIRYKFFLSFPKISITKQKDYIDKIIKSKTKIILGLYMGKNLIFSSGIQVLKRNKISLGILNIDTKYKRKGIAKVFLYCIMYYFKNFLNIKNFIAGVDMQNLPSLKLFKSLNFKLKYKNNKSYIFELNSNNLKNINYLSIETR